MTGEMGIGQRVFIMTATQDIHGEIVRFIESCGELMAVVRFQNGVTQGVPMFKLRRAEES